MLRTHTCGQLKLIDIGKQVSLCGWVRARRDHGSLIFIDLRDRYGITQIVFNPKHNHETHKKANSIKSEYVIRVEGEVVERPNGTKNKNIPTGEIEVQVNCVDILSISEQLPFDIERSLEVSEEVRLIHRYLDLRNSQLQNNLIIRCKVIKTIRDFLDREEFLEIETPLLTKSTPEGARDYLVPARLSREKFYALPQSPQLFKQILMVAGMDKYFQIARCFRDEDLRADRQPEFTQLDLELSFIQEEDIYSLTERLLKDIFNKVLKLNLEIPFLRYSYREVIKKFGTEKPDLKREDNFKFLWVDKFPLLKFNDEEKRWESEHHPFTAPLEEDIPLLEKEPEKVRAKAYDLVLNGIEIASGSIRIHNKKLQEKILGIIGMTQEGYRRKFGFLLDALSYGAPPHGGIAFGLDRLIAVLLNQESIREVIAFPKTQKGICLLTQAPTVISKRQLDELGIKIKGCDNH